MPYIRQELRGRYDEVIAALGPIDTPGELNYLISRLAHDYIAGLGDDYAAHNEVIGVLECAKLELYRMRTAALEEISRGINGDLP